MPRGGEGVVPDDVNIQLLLAKLPADSLARRLVAPFATHPNDEASNLAQAVLTAVKDAHRKGDLDATAEAS